MAVLVEAVSVVVRADALMEKIPGDWDALQAIVHDPPLCTDHEIARAGFMAPQEAALFVHQLQHAGLEFLRAGHAVDIAVVDQLCGPTTPCDWLEFGQVNLGGNGPRVAACRLAGGRAMEVVTPSGWKFEDSLSASFSFVPGKHTRPGWQYLRRAHGLDVYFDPATGKELYVGHARTPA